MTYTANANVSYGPSDATVFPDGATTWTHIVATLDGSTIKVYVNGVEAGDGSMAGVTMGDYTSAKNVYVGARLDGYPDDHIDAQYEGAIDDFRIFDKVLSSSEIEALYNSGSGTEASSGSITGRRIAYSWMAKEPETESMTAWCFDYTTTLSGDVGTIEVPLLPDRIFLKAGYGGVAEWSKARDGIIEPARDSPPSAA